MDTTALHPGANSFTSFTAPTVLHIPRIPRAGINLTYMMIGKQVSKIVRRFGLWLNNRRQPLVMNQKKLSQGQPGSQSLSNASPEDRANREKPAGSCGM